MSSPAPATAPRSVRILRILVIVVLAGGLALAVGIGIGRYAMGSRIADVVGTAGELAPGPMTLHAGLAGEPRHV